MQNITIPELNTYIQEEVVLPDIKQEVERLIKSKNRWLLLSVILDVISHISSAIATVLSFSAGFYKLELLAFLSGIINIVSLLSLLFSKYCNEQNKKNIEQLQKIPILNIFRPNIISNI